MSFATKRAHPDTGTSISYLPTIVIDTDQSNCLKMVHLFKYVRGNKYLTLILSADNSGMIKWYIDGSYTVHPHMQGHTGRGMTMGLGLPISASIKQKLKNRGSTKSETFGVDQLMTLVPWTSIF